MVKIVLLALITLLVSLLITPFIIKLALKINATDKPDERKVHKSPTPTMGGVAIFLSFCIGVVILQPESQFHLAIMAGALAMILLGIFDDLYNLPAKTKFAVQVAAAAVVVFGGGLQLHFINLPFGGKLEFGILGSLITIIWIVGITNAINLIDGLDGLAAGVSSIALLTTAFMAMAMGNVYVFTMAVILLFSTLGFLKFNFFPARIFMGDTGALFLGYMIAVLALLGFKNVTIISFVIPLLILGVPISDTLISMVRRYINKQPMTQADSSHLHHRLIGFGLTHKQTVLFIYLLSGMFSLAAILFSMATVWGAILITLIALVTVQSLIENLDLINSNFKPLTNIVKVIRHNSKRI